jgi:RNA polymerase-binding transcription factor DksA
VAKTRKKTAKKKPAARKKAPAKKTAARRPAPKTTTKKKTTARKPAAKKKPARKKAPARKPAAKKTTSKKKVAKKPAAKKPAAKKTTARKPVTGKTAKKPVTKKAASSKKKTSARTRDGRKRGRTVAEAASTATADDKGYVFIKGRRVRMISTKGQPPVKKTRTRSRAAEVETTEVTEKKTIKTKLTKRELDKYRERLLRDRSELIGDLSAMEQEALRSNGGGTSHMPIHMADIGTDTFDQDFMLGMAENERRRLREIDEALQRIVDRTYGICQMTGKPIPKTRLEAKPWAKYTIEAARQLEGQWGT